MKGELLNQSQYNPLRESNTFQTPERPVIISEEELAIRKKKYLHYTADHALK